MQTLESCSPVTLRSKNLNRNPRYRRDRPESTMRSDYAFNRVEVNAEPFAPIT
jgi:hypothetical protein